MPQSCGYNSDLCSKCKNYNCSHHPYHHQNPSTNISGGCNQTQILDAILASNTSILNEIRNLSSKLDSEYLELNEKLDTIISLINNEEVEPDSIITGVDGESDIVVYNPDNTLQSGDKVLVAKKTIFGNTKYVEEIVT